MALVLDATAKGASSNSYVTVAEATSYFEGRLDADEWTTAVTATNEDTALVMACSRLEQERYVGLPTTTTQRLQWPRSGVPDLNAWPGIAGMAWDYRGGWAGSYYDQDTVPRFVKEAQFELALALLKNTALLDDTGLEGFENVKIGPLDVTPRFDTIGGELPANVQRLLRGLLYPTPGMTAVVRG